MQYINLVAFYRHSNWIACSIFLNRYMSEILETFVWASIKELSQKCHLKYRVYWGSMHFKCPLQYPLSYSRRCYFANFLKRAFGPARHFLILERLLLCMYIFGKFMEVCSLPSDKKSLLHHCFSGKLPIWYLEQFEIFHINSSFKCNNYPPGGNRTQALHVLSESANHYTKQLHFGAKATNFL